MCLACTGFKQTERNKYEEEERQAEKKRIERIEGEQEGGKEGKERQRESIYYQKIKKC